MRSLPQAITENILIASKSFLTSLWYILLSAPGATNPSSLSITLHFLEFQVNGILQYRLRYVRYSYLETHALASVSEVHSLVWLSVLPSGEFVSLLFWDTSLDFLTSCEHECKSQDGQLFIFLVGNTTEGGDEVTRKVYVSQLRDLDRAFLLTSDTNTHILERFSFLSFLLFFREWTPGMCIRVCI